MNYALLVVLSYTTGFGTTYSSTVGYTDVLVVRRSRVPNHTHIWLPE